MKKVLFFALLMSSIAQAQLQDVTHFFDFDAALVKKLSKHAKDTDNPAPAIVVYENVLNPHAIHVEMCHDWLPAHLTKGSTPDHFWYIGRDRRTGLKLYVSATRVKKACKM